MTRVADVWRRFNQRLFFWAEAMSARRSRVGAAAFFDSRRFPWTAQIEAEWPAIRAELDAILETEAAIPCFQDISPEQAAITTDRLWKTFVLVAYGHRFPRNCARCPQTTRILRRIPGLRTAFFSILHPGKDIPFHRGPYNGVLRYHLGLRVPKPESACGIIVGRELAHWREGASLVFDDSHLHRAWNHADGLRVVLFVDFLRPLAFPASLLNALYVSYLSIGPRLRHHFSPQRHLVEPVVDT